MFTNFRSLLTVSAVVFVLSLPSLGIAAPTQFNFSGDLSALYGPGTMTYANDTEDVTLFNSTSAFGLPALPGDPSGNKKVMQFPAFQTNTQGYLFDTGVQPNGGGTATMVNQYTLIWDILIPDVATAEYTALFNTNATNSNDGDMFFRYDGVNAVGIGTRSAYDGSLSANTWYRVAITYDATINTGADGLFKYVDGSLVGSQRLDDYNGGQGKGGIDGRWSLSATGTGSTWLFADEDGETNLGFVSSIYFTDRVMSGSEIAALGGPTAGGVVPEPGTFVLLVVGAVTLLAVRLWKRR